MAEATLLLDAVLLLAIGLVYGAVGRVTIRRHVEGDGKLAAKLFGFWWYALALLQAVSAGVRVLAYFDALPTAIYVTITYVTILVLCASLWALVYYLSYLFTGSRRLLGPITAFYVAYYAFLTYYITLREPIGVAIASWGVELEYAREIAGAPLALLVLLLVVPPILGALGYARLFTKVEDATQRYRIGLVSFSLAAWFGIVLFAWITELSEQPWWQFASRGVSLTAALLVYSAYRPPGWVRKRWGVQPIDEASPG